MFEGLAAWSRRSVETLQTAVWIFLNRLIVQSWLQLPSGPISISESLLFRRRSFLQRQVTIDRRILPLFDSAIRPVDTDCVNALGRTDTNQHPRVLRRAIT